MLNFSTIVPHLQIKIAEKMGYFDQMEFGLSSKLGKQLVPLMEHKAVFNIFEIGMDETEIYFEIKAPKEEGRVQRKWSRITQTDGLPRFKVWELLIWKEVSIQPIINLIEKCDFVESEVGFKVIGRNPSLEVFEKLAQTFKITSLKLVERPDPILVGHPWFREIEDITIIIDDIPEEQLSLLKASTIQFNENTGPSRLCSLSNQYFQQWFAKTRSIEYLNIYTNKQRPENIVLNKEVLLQGLRFSKVTEEKATLLARDESGLERTYGVDEDGDAYLVDRGDRTLLICVYEFQSFNLLIAQEVTDIVIKFQDLADK